MIKLLFILLMTVSLNLYAADTSKTATVSWQPVTKRVDGTDFPVADLKGYILTYQRNSDPVKSINITSGTNSKIQSMGPGVYKFSLKAVANDGAESDPATTQVIIDSRPAMPVLTITLTCDTGCTGQLTAP